MTGRQGHKHTAFLWHRRIGLVAIALVLVLAITGISLNHTESLKLDEAYIDSALLLRWYGLEPEGEAISYDVGEHIITVLDHQVFFNTYPVTTTEQTFRGAVKTAQLIVLAFDSELVLLTTDGEFVERMPTGHGFSDIQRIGIKYQRPVIETAEPHYYMADEHMLDWDVIINDEVSWAQSTTLDPTKMAVLLESFRGRGLTLERVILDLHSGRIFGELGVYVMDAAALALLWLSLSGLWVGWRRSLKQKRKRHYQKHHRVQVEHRPS
ncbi:MAG: PepSY domain-containing protein [Gammaproteobacteria bacterium]